MGQDSGVSLSDLVRAFGGELLGNGDQIITGLGTLSSAGATEIAFLSNSKYRHQLSSTHAGAVIVGLADRDASSLPGIVTDNPYAYQARVSALFNPLQRPLAGIHASAVVVLGWVSEGRSPAAWAQGAWHPNSPAFFAGLRDPPFFP